MNAWTRVMMHSCFATFMTLALLGCEAEVDAEAAAESSVTQDESGAGSVDVVSSTPNVETPPEVAVDAGPSTVDTAEATADTVTEPDEPVEPVDPEVEDDRYGNEIIVGQGACTNDADIEALQDFDPVADFMTVGMVCINPRSSPGETDDELLISCLVGELNSGYGFSEECGTCVALHVVCSQENCMDKCMSFMMTGEISDECTQCIDESDCKSDFTGCSGLDPDQMQP